MCIKEIREFNNKVAACDKCKQSLNPRPFYFKIHNPECKIMLITWKPSIQALYRPLFSTRFFRELCLALFGANYNGKDYVDIFNSGEIFWTHLQKCYSEGQNNSAQEQCSKFHIIKELKIIKPELVIVLGKDAREFIETKKELLK